ncbi:MAG: methyltransferase domain-containing protein [Planctomycetes bacterium]|jgi:ubiquinone/menaquinone biosynthesis C-methylase UbiE|nr:methyltransferase domain-containing protein [Planctomycetota bacterium]
MKVLAKRLARKLHTILVPPPAAKAVPLRNPYPIRTSSQSSRSHVDEYWGEHTIKSEPFATAQDGLDWLKYRSKIYPLSFQFKGLWDDHQGKVLVDYGCGPGHDLMGFQVFSRPAKVYGIDISHKALSLAGHNSALHNIPAERIELIQTGDLSDRIPLSDGCVDYVHCCGVLHHTTAPEVILKEFHRILKPGGKGMLMIYNTDSLFVHLYIAYVKRFVDSDCAGLSVEEIFTRSTDGASCPISRSYRGAEFAEICQHAGFDTEYLGGFVACNELDLWDQHGAKALRDARLGEPHKSFLKQLDWDASGLPYFQGKAAGVGGSFRIRKQ